MSPVRPADGLVALTGRLGGLLAARGVGRTARSEGAHSTSEVDGSGPPEGVGLPARDSGRRRSTYMEMIQFITDSETTTGRRRAVRSLPVSPRRRHSARGRSDTGRSIPPLAFMVRYTADIGDSTDYTTTRRSADLTGAHVTVTVDVDGDGA